MTKVEDGDGAPHAPEAAQAEAAAEVQEVQHAHAGAHAREAPDLQTLATETWKKTLKRLGARRSL